MPLAEREGGCAEFFVHSEVEGLLTLLPKCNKLRIISVWILNPYCSRVPGSNSYCVCKEGRFRLELSHGTFRLVMPRSVISKWAKVPIAHMLAYDTLVSRSMVVERVVSSPSVAAQSEKKRAQFKAVKPIPVDSVVVPRVMGASEQNWRTWAARTCGASAYVLSKLSTNTAGSKDCPTEIPKGYSNTNWFDAGVLGKMRKTPSLPKENKATRFREFISMDYLVMNEPSVRGHRYALNIVDHFSGVPKSYTCKTRDEVQYYILQYLAETEYLCGELTTVTFNNTSFKKISVNDNVNLEFDVIGKYVSRLTNF